MVDAHCHLNFHAFEKDLDQVIKEAVEAGVDKIVTVGAKIDSSKKAVEIADKFDCVYASVGVHPHHADKLENGWLDRLEDLTKNKKVLSIGEVGLDYFSYKSNDIVDPKLQKEIFVKQLELAYKLKLPLQIHNRHAGKDLYDILLNYKNLLLSPPGMIHCFSGSMDFLKKILDLGFYVGFDGNITYEGKAPGEGTDLKDLVKYAPIDRILTETDSPYLSPVPFKGLRNIPKNVIIVAEFVSDLKGIDRDKFFETIGKNFKKVFKNKYDL